MRNLKTGIGAALIFLLLVLACADTEQNPSRSLYSSTPEGSRSPSPVVSPSVKPKVAEKRKPSKTTRDGKTSGESDYRVNRGSYPRSEPKTANPTGATALCRDGTPVTAARVAAPVRITAV